MISANGDYTSVFVALLVLYGVVALLGTVGVVASIRLALAKGRVRVLMIAAASAVASLADLDIWLATGLRMAAILGLAYVLLWPGPDGRIGFEAGTHLLWIGTALTLIFLSWLTYHVAFDFERRAQVGARQDLTVTAESPETFRVDVRGDLPPLGRITGAFARAHPAGADATMTEVERCPGCLASYEATVFLTRERTGPEQIVDLQVWAQARAPRLTGGGLDDGDLTLSVSAIEPVAATFAGSAQVFVELSPEQPVAVVRSTLSIPTELSDLIDAGEAFWSPNASADEGAEVVGLPMAAFSWCPSGGCGGSEYGVVRLLPGAPAASVTVTYTGVVVVPAGADGLDRPAVALDAAFPYAAARLVDGLPTVFTSELVIEATPPRRGDVLVAVLTDGTQPRVRRASCEPDDCRLEYRSVDDWALDGYWAGFDGAAPPDGFEPRLDLVADTPYVEEDW